MKITPEKLNYYLGKFEQCYFGYSLDKHIRNGAASGGITTTLLLDMLSKGQIQGAVITKTFVEGDKLQAHNFIATTKEEILNARTSVYMDFDFWQILDQIKKFDGRVAIVALPCQIKALAKLIEKEEILKEKIYCLIGLFCGHISKPELINQVLIKNKVNIKEIKKFIFRKGHWRGKSHIIFRDGSEKDFSFKKFSIYQNLFFCSAEKCLHCSDHTAEEADISLGDIWDSKMKKQPIKHNALIVRKSRFKSYLHDLVESNKLALKEVDPLAIFKAQKRSLIYHKHSNARSIIGKIFGYRIQFSKSSNNLWRWNDLLSAFFIILNIKISKSRFIKRIIFLLPEKIWLPYLYLIKILINF